jgi:hypothetical protein
MAIADCCCGAAVESEALDRLLKVVELLRKIQRADQNLIPSTA